MTILELLPNDAHIKLWNIFALERELIRNLDENQNKEIYLYELDKLFHKINLWIFAEARDKECEPGFANSLENFFYCPNCNTVVKDDTIDFEMEFEDFPNFCENCGVKLDWNKKFMIECGEMYVEKWWCRSQLQACEFKNEKKCQDCGRFD